MDSIVDFVGGIVGGILDIGGDIVATAVGAVMSWLGTAVEAMAAVAENVIDLLPDAADLGLEIPGGWIYGYSIVNTFLPISEALAFVAVFTVLVIGAVAFRLAVIVYHLIPKPLMGT